VSLGLDQLTDGQLLELLQEAWAEVSTRSAITQSLAVQDNRTAAEKMQEFQSLIGRSIDEHRRLERAQLKDLVDQEARRELEAGELRLLSPEEEASLITEATLTARISVLKVVCEALRRGDYCFSCEIAGPHVVVVSGGRKAERTVNWSKDRIGKMIAALHMALE